MKAIINSVILSLCAYLCSYVCSAFKMFLLIFEYDVIFQ